MKRSKRYREIKEKIKEVKNIDEALSVFKDSSNVKFDESVEVHVKLNIDPSKSEQQVRFSIELPHGIGKETKVAVFAEGDKAKEAQSAGADMVLGEADIERIFNKKRKIDFDVVVAVPPMMPKLAKIAKILGPKGLMPSPKNETVTINVKQVVEKLKKGMETLKNDSGGSIHIAIGKISFDKKKLIENYKVFVEELEKQKTKKIKGKLIKACYISTTMGPSVKLLG